MSQLDQYIKECNEQMRREMFALPIAPKLAATIDGMELYTSNNLKSKYIDAMKKTGRCKNVGDDIERLVDKGYLTPVWLNKGLFRLSIFKIFAPMGIKSTMGFYSPRHDKIFLLIDNNITLGFASNVSMAHLTIHECMHMACNHMGNSFVSLFKPELVEYYNAMFKDLLTIKNDVKRESEIFMKFIFKMLEFRKMTNDNYIQKLLPHYMAVVQKLFQEKSELDNAEFEQKVLRLGQFIQFYDKDVDLFIRNIRNYSDVYSSLKRGYSVGLKTPNNMSLTVQELIYPSEVICMYSELASPSKLNKVYKAFKKI